MPHTFVYHLDRGASGIDALGVSVLSGFNQDRPEGPANVHANAALADALYTDGDDPSVVQGGEDRDWTVRRQNPPQRSVVMESAVEGGERDGIAANGQHEVFGAAAELERTTNAVPPEVSGQPSRGWSTVAHEPARGLEAGQRAVLPKLCHVIGAARPADAEYDRTPDAAVLEADLVDLDRVFTEGGDVGQLRRRRRASAARVVEASGTEQKQRRQMRE